MTIQPKQDCFTVHCDTCSEYFVNETLDIDVLAKFIKFKGWKTYKDEHGDVFHKCPACEEGK